MRDKDIFTDKEKYRVATDIVENAKMTKIRLKYTTNDIGTTYTHQGNSEVARNHVVTLGKIRGVERFTLLNHELGHIMFDSPLESARRMIDKWIEEKYRDDDMNEGYYEKIFNIYWTALNLIEDQRIESLMSKLWLKNAIRFDKAKVNCGNDLYKIDTYEKEDLLSPIQTLQAIRFLKGGLVRDNDSYDMARAILERIEGTGPKGSLVALRMYKKYIDEHIDSIMNELNDSMENYNKDCQKQGSDWEDSLIKTLNIAKLNAKEKLCKAVASNAATPSYTNTKTQFCENMQTLEPTKEYEGSATDNELQEHMKEAKEQGKRQLSTIKQAIEEGSSECALRNGVDKVYRHSSRQGVPIKDVAKGMNKIFGKMTEIPRDNLNDEGDEVDIEAYISGKIGGSINECLIDTKYSKGASILVSVDGSCSMDDSDNSIGIARDVVATMYKSIYNIDEIELKALVWSANKRGDMNVTKVNSLKDTCNISIADDYCLTPTHLAIRYSTNLLSKMKGRKKLLILITDGFPQYFENFRRINTNVLIQLGKKAMIKGLRKCPNIMVMLIKPTTYAQECCKSIFGNRLMVVDDMDKGGDIILKKFTKTVMGALK